MALRKPLRRALTPAQKQVGSLERKRLEMRLWRVIERSGLPLPDQYEYQFAPYRKYRADAAYVAPRLLLEVEGGIWINGRHNRAPGFDADCRKYGLAAALGWRVVRVTAEMIDDGTAVQLISLALNEPLSAHVPAQTNGTSGD